MRTSWRRTAGLLGIPALLLLVVGLGRPADAQAPKAEFKLKLMGINRTLDPWKLFQDWAQAVEKKTNGRVQFELTSLPELGLGGAETIRVIKTGVVDVAEIYGGYVAGELPMVEIVEVPGIFPDGPTAKKAIQAWKPQETKLLDQKANAVVLAMAVYPDQAFFSKRPIRGRAHGGSSHASHSRASHSDRRGAGRDRPRSRVGRRGRGSRVLSIQRRRVGCGERLADDRHAVGGAAARRRLPSRALPAVVRDVGSGR